MSFNCEFKLKWNPSRLNSFGTLTNTYTALCRISLYYGDEHNNIIFIGAFSVALHFEV